MEKKEEEKKLADDVLQMLGFDYYTIIGDCKQERPDLFIEFKKDYFECIVACEVTTYFSDSKRKIGSLEKRSEMIWKKIAKKLQNRLDVKGYEHCFGIFHFKNTLCNPIDSLNTEVGKFICETLTLLEKYTCKTQIIEFPLNDYFVLNKHFIKLVLRKQSVKSIPWKHADSQSGEVPDAEDALIECINEKIGKERSYNWKDALLKWLLIVAEGEGKTDVAIIRKNPLIPKNPFTWIILWNHFPLDEIIELDPIPRKLCDGGKQVINVDYFPKELKPFVVGGHKYCVKIKAS